MNTFGRICIASTLLMWASADASAATATRLAVFPTNINLNTTRDRQSFVAIVTRPDGVTLDVSSKVQVKLADPAIARVDGQMLYPLADGTTKLEISWEGQRVEIPVTVKEAKTDRPISFALDVMPVFMRTGCNTGSCHGAARGKDGFNLSLFGYDPNGDHYRLTHELGFRRINLALPAESLLLEKTDGTVPHTGGKRYGRESEFYQTVLRWLEAGGIRTMRATCPRSCESNFILSRPCSKVRVHRSS